MKTKEKITQTPAPMPSPEYRTPTEIVSVIADVAVRRATRPAPALLAVGILAGICIAFACIATLSVTCTIDNASIARMLTGLLFPFGLCLIIFTGGELYTGNCLMIVGILEKKIQLQGMFYNWFYVYIGNFIGCMMVVFTYTSTYHLHGFSGNLALNMMRTAATKSSISSTDAFVLAIWCNMLVCIAVLITTGARDPIGKAAGAIIPVSFFVMSGFEHCVANMAYIPMGMIAAQNSELRALAVAANINVDALTVSNFLMNNLIPVTLGNAVGGLGIGILMWYCNLGKGNQPITKK